MTEITQDHKAQPILKTGGKHSWALINWGIVVAVFRTRKECMEYAEYLTGKNWPKCSHYYDARKVTITEGWHD